MSMATTLSQAFRLVTLLVACKAPATETPGLSMKTTEEAHPPIQVHLSLDDMPLQVERGTDLPLTFPYEGTNNAILRTLARHQVKASVFVTCDRLQPGDGMVKAWQAGGHAVGNHTFSHAPLNRMPTEEWLADVSQCHSQLTALLGEAPSWFRFPYLGHGRDRASQEAARAGLQRLGYRNVPVTVSNSEWMFAYAYRRAKTSGDNQRADQVVDAWHTHMDDSLAVAREMAMVAPGREIVHVQLIHVNELIADHLGELIARWQDRGVSFVDVETAMADPVYAMENHFSGGGGISWLARIQPKQDPMKYWFGLEEGRIIKALIPPTVNE